MRTQEQINDELTRLQVPACKIEAQISVLSGQSDADDFLPNEDDEDDGMYDSMYEVYQAARDAEDWLTGDLDDLADEWEPLVQQ